ncbi:MAG: response regulator transcription factor [Bacilli bacterium]|nr:response regulator transcription factor [Bacilli bacterium]
MLKVAIVEDDPHYSTLLQRFVEKFQEETHRNLKVDIFSNGLNFVSDYNDGYNIAILDIEMPLMDGITAAKKIRAFDQNVTIIFITNMAKLAIKGYEIDALDFMVKPIDYFNFYLKMEKAIRIQEKFIDNFIMINSYSGKVRIRISDIKFVESNFHDLTYHTIDGNYETRNTLKSIEGDLSKYNFIRVNNSFLVNMAFIERIEGENIFIDKHTIQISRSKKRDVLAAIGVFYGGIK